MFLNIKFSILTNWNVLSYCYNLLINNILYIKFGCLLDFHRRTKVFPKEKLFRKIFGNKFPRLYICIAFGSRIRRWKGNPVKVRNYPRSCKFRNKILPEVPLILKHREGGQKGISQKTCRVRHCRKRLRVKAAQQLCSKIACRVNLPRLKQDVKFNT